MAAVVVSTIPLACAVRAAARPYQVARLGRDARRRRLRGLRAAEPGRGLGEPSPLAITLLFSRADELRAGFVLGPRLPHQKPKG